MFNLFGGSTPSRPTNIRRHIKLSAWCSAGSDFIKVQIVEQSHRERDFSDHGDTFNGSRMTLCSSGVPEYQNLGYCFVRGHSHSADEDIMEMPNEAYQNLKHAVMEYNEKYS